MGFLAKTDVLSDLFTGVESSVAVWRSEVSKSVATLKVSEVLKGHRVGTERILISVRGGSDHVPHVVVHRRDATKTLRPVKRGVQTFSKIKLWVSLRNLRLPEIHEAVLRSFDKTFDAP